MNNILSQEELLNFIKNNINIKNYKKNKDKTIDFNSLSFLLDKKISQSDSIRLGIILEKIFKDIVLEFSDNKDIKPKNKKGKKEIDHLFINEKEKTIYYAELKGNINLDTEKSKITSQKCLKIFEELKLYYKDYDIKWFLVAFRYVDKNDIPKKIKDKYKDIFNNVLGINNYFQKLNIEIYDFNEKTYRLFINEISKNIHQ